MSEGRQREGALCGWTRRGLARPQTAAQWTRAGSGKANLSAGSPGSPAPPPEGASSVGPPQGAASPALKCVCCPSERRPSETSRGQRCPPTAQLVLPLSLRSPCSRRNPRCRDAGFVELGTAGAGEAHAIHPRVHTHHMPHTGHMPHTPMHTHATHTCHTHTHALLPLSRFGAHSRDDFPGAG